MLLLYTNVPVAHSHVIRAGILLGRPSNLCRYEPGVSRVQNILRFHCLGNAELSRLLIPGCYLVLDLYCF